MFSKLEKVLNKQNVTIFIEWFNFHSEQLFVHFDFFRHSFLSFHNTHFYFHVYRTFYRTASAIKVQKRANLFSRRIFHFFFIKATSKTSSWSRTNNIVFCPYLCPRPLHGKKQKQNGRDSFIWTRSHCVRAIIKFSENFQPAEKFRISIRSGPLCLQWWLVVCAFTSLLNKCSLWCWW